MTAAYDAVVVGAGPNGLVAANLLADAGWRVLVLEQQQSPGGAVRSTRDVHPDFEHDTFSAFYPLAAASPTIRSLRLEEHGLEWVHAPAALGHASAELPWTILHREREDTAAGLEAQHAGDGDAWLRLCEAWDRIEEPLLEGMLTPFPPVRAGGGLLARLPRAGGMDLVKLLLTPVSEIGRQRFGGPGPGLLLSGNAGHADIPPDAAGSGLFGLLLTMLGQNHGFPVPRGGAGRLTDALVRRFESRGGQLRCGAAATRIVVHDRRAVAVLTDDERYDVGRAVIADTTAPLLFGGLVPPDDLPPRIRRGMRGFQMDPGTVKVDWALSAPVPWAQPPPAIPGTVHVADSLTEMSAALSQVGNGLVPERPFMLTGQMTSTDPSRSPAGTESMWAYAHVPQPDHTVGDAGEAGIRGTWDPSERERFADRMQQRLERVAPGFGDRVLSRRVLGPHEMEAHNANLIGGAVGGGTAQIHQELFLRPVPGMLGRAETGIAGLYLGSSSAHPGGGVHGAAGSNAARAAIFHDRFRSARARILDLARGNRRA